MLENILLPYSVNGKRYFADKKLGEGVNGAVYNGYALDDPEQENPLAIKISTLGNNNKRVQAIQTEVKNLQELKFPHTAKYYDHCLESQLPYLIREFIPETLEDKMAKNEITQELIIRYINQMTIFLSFLNYKGKIHNDLTGKNIGYSDIEGIKILDIGYLETPGYKEVKKNYPHPSYAPEFSKDKLLTSKSDIYTVGKSLQYLLTSDYEMKAKEAIDFMELIYDVNLPDTFKQLLEKMTLENPEHRINHNNLVTLSLEATQDLNKGIYFTPQPFQLICITGEI